MAAIVFQSLLSSVPKISTVAAERYRQKLRPESSDYGLFVRVGHQLSM